MISSSETVSYTHLRAHETREDLVCRLLLEKKYGELPDNAELSVRVYLPDENE